MGATTSSADMSLSRRTGRGWVMLAVIAGTAAVVLAMLGLYWSGLGPEVAAGDTASASVAFTEAETDAEVGDGPAPAAVATYAGLDVALIEARGVENGSSGRPVIVLDLAVRNTRGTQARVPAELFTLVAAPAGEARPEEMATEIAVDRFEYTRFGDRLVIEPGSVEQGLAVFHLPPMMPPELERFSLVMAEEGRLPVVLPLTGIGESIESYGSPALTVDVDEDADGVDVAVEGVEASSRLDYGAYRTMDGHRLVVVSLRLQTSDRARSAVDVAGKRDNWALATSTDDVRPLRIESTPGPDRAAGRTTEIRLVFEVPAAETDAALLMGPAESRSVVADVDLVPIG